MVTLDMCQTKGHTDMSSGHLTIWTLSKRPASFTLTNNMYTTLFQKQVDITAKMKAAIVLVFVVVLVAITGKAFLLSTSKISVIFGGTWCKCLFDV